MNTISFSSVILILLSLVGLVSCLYFGTMQFIHRSAESTEEQLSHQFFSGIILIASSLVWGMSAWHISDSNESNANPLRQAESLAMINSLPATAAGIPDKILMPDTTTPSVQPAERFISHQDCISPKNQTQPSLSNLN